MINERNSLLCAKVGWAINARNRPIVLKKSVFLEFWLNWQTFTILRHCFYWKKFPVHAELCEKATFSTQSGVTSRSSPTQPSYELSESRIPTT
jgi:hypothetical protein